MLNKIMEISTTIIASAWIALGILWLVFDAMTGLYDVCSFKQVIAFYAITILFYVGMCFVSFTFTTRNMKRRD